MKKLLASLLVICTLLSCMIIGVSAGAPGGNSTYVQGVTIWGQFPLIWTIKFAPTDITGAVSLKFDLFVSKAADFKMDAFEVGSVDACDTEERQFGLSAFGTLQDGWNTVTMSLNGGEQKQDALFNFAAFKRIRMFRNVERDKEANVTVGLRNIVAVKDDGTEIKVGAAPAAPAKENAPIVIDAKNYEQFDSYKLDGTYNKHDAGLYMDANMYSVLMFTYEGTPKSAELKLPAGNGFLILASKDNKDYTEIARSTITGKLDSQDLVLDLTAYLGDGAIFVKIADATPEDGNGAFINGGDKKIEFSVSYETAAPETEAPSDPVVEPTTFDAAASVAVAAIAAMGIVLVASKKRH